MKTLDKDSKLDLQSVRVNVQCAKVEIVDDVAHLVVFLFFMFLSLC